VVVAAAGEEVVHPDVIVTGRRGLVGLWFDHLKFVVYSY
jgi:hypothetical protein